ncbi:MAG: endonuclease III [Prevotella sp.]
MTRKERYKAVLDYFRGQMPVVTTELEFGSAFQLLCATLLSAQCTDKRVNQITPALFAAYPTAKEMAAAEPEEVFEYVRSVSYPNAKSRHLVEMARMIVSDFGGEVPEAVNDLVKLPGVGRKTANVMQAVWFGRAAMAVDTHVYRVSHRMGLVGKADNTPLKVEQRLMANIPADDVPRAHHWLLLHGRYVCKSVRPKCEECIFNGICPKILDDSKLS